MSHRNTLLMAPVALLLLGTAPAVLAGTGFGDSGPATIDTRPPAVTVDDPAPNTVLQTGAQISLNYALSDDHPGSDPGDNRTEVWFGNQLWETSPDIPGSGTGTWTWTVPDTSSATVHLVVTATDAYGNVTTVSSTNFTILSGVTDVPDATTPGVVFRPPVPNPFNPQTDLRFELPTAGDVRIGVYDARGHLVRTLVRGHQAAGPLTVAWNGRDGSGRRLAAGTYIFRLDYRDGGQARVALQKATLLP